MPWTAASASAPIPTPSADGAGSVIRYHVQPMATMTDPAQVNRLALLALELIGVAGA